MDAILLLPCDIGENCPPLFLDHNFIVGAERVENRVELSGAMSGAMSGRCRKKRWSGARNGKWRSGNGAVSGGCRNRLERGAAFSRLTLRSHALLVTAKGIV